MDISSKYIYNSVPARFFFGHIPQIQSRYLNKEKIALSRASARAQNNNNNYKKRPPRSVSPSMKWRSSSRRFFTASTSTFVMDLGYTGKFTTITQVFRCGANESVAMWRHSRRWSSISLRIAHLVAPQRARSIAIVFGWMYDASLDVGLSRCLFVYKLHVTCRLQHIYQAKLKASTHLYSELTPHRQIRNSIQRIFLDT